MDKTLIVEVKRNRSLLERAKKEIQEESDIVTVHRIKQYLKEIASAEKNVKDMNASLQRFLDKNTSLLSHSLRQGEVLID